MNREYVIYGINRVAKDFIYVFKDRLNIVGIYDDRSDLDNLEYFKDIPIINELNSEPVIICDFDKTQKEKKLTELGLSRGNGYYYEEDFFDDLDNIQLPQNRKILLWGIGNKGKRFLERNHNVTVDCIVDSNYIGEYYQKYQVYKPGDIKEWGQYIVVITPNNDYEIVSYLENMGLKKNIDYIKMEDFEFRPSNLLRKTIFDKSYYDFECNTMLNHFEILGGGIGSCCCTTFVDERLGNILDDGFENVWKSSIHKVLCLSTQNHTYSFCKKDMCPFFIGKNAKTNDEVSNKYQDMLNRPKVVALGYDSTCNLKCSTCRKDYKIAKGNELERQFIIADDIRKNLLKDCEFLIAAGNGEVLLSDSYKRVYLDRDCDNIKSIRLLSNGLLFDEKHWEELKNEKKGEIKITISIDAATESTYKIIRCGGDFNRLKRNMQFASKLRKSGELSYFRINFVVQRNNYKEMVDFVKWGKELGCDEVFFTKILNWGTYTPEEFKNISMMEEDGITPKPELMEILNNPIMNDPIVDLGTIQTRHEPVAEKHIDNYYIWEMERKVDSCV